MNNEQWTFKRVIGLILLCLVMVGCRRELSAEEYYTEYRQIVTTYHQILDQQEAHPFDNIPEERDERPVFLANIIRGDASQFAVLVQQAKRIDPPRRYDLFHEAVVNYLNVFVVGYQGVADALELSSRAEIDAAFDRMGRELSATLAQVRREEARLREAGSALPSLQK